MKAKACVVAGACLLSLAGTGRSAETVAPDVSALLAEERARLFASAQEAYDAKQFDEAIAAYRQILNSGYISTALFFNLGNAYFRSGEMGRAVLAYKRALYLSPRDPDAKANLAFALQTADVPETQPTLPTRVLGHLSQGEWMRLATGAWWVLALALLFALWNPRRRPPAHRVAIGAGLLLALAIMGVLHWRGLRQQAEVVVTAPGQEVLFAPLAGSTAHFAAPEGSVFRVEDEADGWLRVRQGERSGWIKAETCAKVIAWAQQDG